MGNNTIENKTNAELKEFVEECESKYQKLLKVANKLAEEMTNLSMQYNEAKDEIIRRQNI